MKIGINAGHTKLGTGTGAVGQVTESIENRKIAYELMKQLSSTNHEVIPIVIDKSSNNLKEAVSVANSKKCDLFISIHLNAGGGQGCECYTYKGEKHKEAINICNNLNKLGFRNRGVKDGTNMYVVKYTTMKAVLVEVCFVDNPNDVQLYKKVGIEKIAEAIKKGVI